MIRRHLQHGYWREAAVAFLETGFADLGVDRTVGITAPGNTRSRRAMEDSGMECIWNENHPGREWVAYEAGR